MDEEAEARRRLASRDKLKRSSSNDLGREISGESDGSVMRGTDSASQYFTSSIVVDSSVRGSSCSDESFSRPATNTSFGGRSPRDTSLPYFCRTAV